MWVGVRGAVGECARVCGWVCACVRALVADTHTRTHTHAHTCTHTHTHAHTRTYMHTRAHTHTHSHSHSHTHTHTRTYIPQASTRACGLPPYSLPYSWRKRPTLTALGMQLCLKALQRKKIPPLRQKESRGEGRLASLSILAGGCKPQSWTSAWPRHLHW